MSLAPMLSVVRSSHIDQSASGPLEAAGDRDLPDIRLSVEDRELVKRVIAQLEQRLGVDGLMFAAARCEDAAIRKRRAAEEAGVR